MASSSWESAWHRHPLFVNSIIAIISAGLALIASIFLARGGNLPGAPDPNAAAESPRPVPTVTVTHTVTAPPAEPMAEPLDEAHDEPTDGPLTTSGPAAGEYLTERDWITGGPDRDKVAINGTEYPNSLYASMGGCDEHETAEWTLGRDFSEFDVVLGLSEESPLRDAQVRFRILADGIVLEDIDLGVAEEHERTYNVEDKLRLVLEAEWLGPGDRCETSAYAAWGTPTLRR